MLSYRALLEYQKKAVNRPIMRNPGVQTLKNETNNPLNLNRITEEENKNKSNDGSCEKSLGEKPGAIRDILLQLKDRKVTIIVDAKSPPIKIEIEAVVGDLLIAETEASRFIFINLNCICGIIVDRDELLKSLINVVFT